MRGDLDGVARGADLKDDVDRERVSYTELDPFPDHALEPRHLERYPVRAGLERLNAVDPLGVCEGRELEVRPILNDRDRHSGNNGA